MPLPSTRHTLLHCRVIRPTLSLPIDTGLRTLRTSSQLCYNLHTRSFTRPTQLRLSRCRNIAHPQHRAWHPTQSHIDRRFHNTPSATLISKSDAMPPFVGAIDQGTTSSRFIIFDTQGAPVAQHQIEFKQIYPHPGYVGEEKVV